VPCVAGEGASTTTPGVVLRLGDRGALVLLLVLSALPMVLLAVLRLRYALPSGDEPHYLIISQAILEHHDLDVQRVYDSAGYVAFYPVPIEPHTAPGPSGRPLPLHGIGGPVLWLVPFGDGDGEPDERMRHPLQGEGELTAVPASGRPRVCAGRNADGLGCRVSRASRRIPGRVRSEEVRYGLPSSIAALDSWGLATTRRPLGSVPAPVPLRRAGEVVVHLSREKGAPPAVTTALVPARRPAPGAGPGRGPDRRGTGSTRRSPRPRSPRPLRRPPAVR
jgi:hypothetical protein